MPQCFELWAPHGPKHNNPRKHKQHTQTHYKNKYVNTNTHKQNKPQNSEEWSDDPDFVKEVHGIHTIIKAGHHLENVSVSDPPPATAKMGQNLVDNIKPAAPNPRTQALIEGCQKLGLYHNVGTQRTLRRSDRG